MNVHWQARWSTRTHAIELVAAILGDPADHAHAEAVIERAHALGVDPLDYCARTLGLGDDLVLGNAAHCCGFAFFHTIPAPETPVPPVRRLDLLATVRTLRQTVLGREVLFCAPRFGDLLNLAAAARSDPEIRRYLCIVPGRAIRAALARRHTDQLLDEARQRLTRQWPAASAAADLPVGVRIAFVALFLSAVLAVVVAPYMFSLAFLPIVALLIVAPALIRLAVVFARPPPLSLPPLLGDHDLPVYSILIPLRDEAGMVPQLHRAMASLDYPPEKLDIKFVVEARSKATIAAVGALPDDPRFELICVPDRPPFTKPKAINYAMPLVRGDCVVVYDAEDLPDRDQLRLAASWFAAAPEIDCLQAELVIDNAEDNWITASFAAEYAGQFGLMMPWLAHWNLPMPLGGTSNHFRTAALRDLGHWDAYNVTEDADLGVRLSRLRHESAMLPSATSEEAPITLRAWHVQRTRWIKGWMQTFIVHNSRPGHFLAQIGWRNFLFFQLYVGTLILSSLLHTVFMASLGLRAALGLQTDLGDPVSLIYVAIMVLGYGASALIVVAGLARLRAWHLVPQQLFLPAYWMMHSVAALNAAYQLLVKPYFWGKTAHGRTRQARRTSPFARTTGSPR